MLVSYFISKVFFDIWDHLTWNVLHSLAVILLTALLVGAFSTGQLLLMVSAVFIAQTGFHLTAMLYLRFLETPQGFPWTQVVKASLILATVHTVVMGLGTFAAWYYLSQNTMTGQTLGFLVIWAMILWFVGNLLTLPLFISFGFDLKRAWQTSWILFFRSPVLFFSSFISGIFLMITTAVILPGCGGQVVVTRTLRDILKRKYDWLETQSERPRRLPWHEILREDRASIENRNFRSLFTPWK